VKYVLMPLNMASSQFRFVEEQKDLKVMRRWGDLVLLKNRVPVSHLTLAGKKGSYTTWEALGKEAVGGNLLGSYLPRGTETTVPQARGTLLVHTDSVTGAVKAALPAAVGRPSWVLFSEPYSPDWRLNGKTTAREQAGVVTAFPLADDTGGNITIRYSNVLEVLGWSLSAVGILLCGLLLLRQHLSAGRSDKEGRNTLEYNQEHKPQGYS
jgi:hypothetical protein